MENYKYRNGARFIRNPSTLARPLNKREIDEIMRKARNLDAFSKKFGCRMGLIGDSGMKVLEVLLLIANRENGLCCPSIRAICQRTTYARSTVCDALKRLQRVKILSWIQTLARKTIALGNSLRQTTVQGTNIYTFHVPNSRAHLLPLLTRVRRIKNKAGAALKILGDVSQGLGSKFFATGSGNPPQNSLDLFPSTLSAPPRSQVGHTGALLGSRLLQPARSKWGFHAGE